MSFGQRINLHLVFVPWVFHNVDLFLLFFDNCGCIQSIQSISQLNSEALLFSRKKSFRNWNEISHGPCTISTTKTLHRIKIPNMTFMKFSINHAIIVTLVKFWAARWIPESSLAWIDSDIRSAINWLEIGQRLTLTVAFALHTQIWIHTFFCWLLSSHALYKLHHREEYSQIY